MPLRKAARADPGAGRVTKSSTTPTTTAATQQKTSFERQKKEIALDVGEDGPPPPKKSRQSRDERQFGKDTEKALRDSAKETSSSPHSSPNPTNRDAEYQPHREEDEEEEEEYIRGDISSDSDFSGEGPALSKRGGKKNKKPAGRGGTSTSVGKTTAQTKPQEKLLKTAVSTAKPAMSAVPTAISSSSVNIASSPRLGVRKMQKWTPPGPANRENHSRDCNLASNGGTPVIRLGLSRRARVKPLHNSPHVPS